MKIFVLDTNILIHYLKNTSLVKDVQHYLNQYKNYITIISVVTKAELQAIALLKNWGNNRLKALSELLSSIAYLDIEYGNEELLNAYASIHAFSQGKTSAPNGQMLGTSSRNMGKNDLWIAATAHALNAILLTTDGDFDHLHNLYFEVKKF